jgi:hypothetical protein
LFEKSGENKEKREHFERFRSVQLSSRKGENERKSKKIESWKTKEGASLLKKMNEITKEIKENE